MTIKVLMQPHLSQFGKEESGIKRVVEAYFKFLPQFDIELVEPDTTTYDIKAVHAGMSGGDCDVTHLHGMYWTADYDAPNWEYDANRSIIEAVRQAKEVTVPSAWVAETFQRDMRFTPHIIGHGIEWDDWQHSYAKQDFILWNKNRVGDVCDPTAIDILAEQFLGHKFVTTFNHENKHPSNVVQTGLLPHPEMKKYIQSAGVYLSTTKETFGIGVLEAMASGTPVLGWNFGGNVGLVNHGVNGYLAEPHDYEDLANGLNFCLKHSKILGENGREMAKRFTWESACEKVAGVYRLAMETKEPYIDVIIPVFNKTVEQLKRCIESVLTQTYTNINEIIVVDDGSDHKLSQEYDFLIDNDLVGVRDCPIRFYQKNNGGVATARNFGILTGVSKYICCLDADDHIGSNFLELCVNALEADDTLGLAYTGLKWFDEKTGKSAISEWPNEWDFDRQINYKRRQNQVPTCNVFRRKVWERLGGFRQRYAPQGAGAEDAEFWTRIGAYGWKCKQVEPVTQVLNTYHAVKKQAKQEPTKDQILQNGISEDAYDLTINSLLHYSTGGQVGSNPSYVEPDWLAWHPWSQDGQHPFASYATSAKQSHPIRQYDKPLVSVIIPVGPGHEKEVINALDSLEAQTFRKWEVIVVWDNNNSNLSNKFDIASNSISNMQSIVYLNKAYPYVKHVFVDGIKGAGYARNRGVEIARAPFLLFLDADDDLHSDCIQKMLNAYTEYETAIYTDYVGQAFIDGELARNLENQNRLDSYNTRTQEAIINHQSFDFDCNRALQQPNNQQPYIWNLITTLIPKQWHIDIGGFDESMDTWEDWDYWLRMVHQGKCFTRLPEELVRYRFYTGQRRNKASGDTDEGRQKANSMIKYLREKYQGVEKMGCGCKGKKNTQQQNLTITAGAKMADDDFVKAKFLGPMGNRHIIGAFLLDHDPGLPSKQNGNYWKMYYGYDVNTLREKGTLVHKEDIRLMVGKWQEIVSMVAPPVTKVEVAIPQPIIEKPSAITLDTWQPELDTPKGGDISQLSSMRMTVTGERPDEQLNLQTLPGITPAIAARLKAKGIDTVDKIQEAGIDGLVEIKGIAESRAKAILKALTE